MNVVRASFRPEFLNRIDEIILFHRLRRSEMGAIVDIQLKRLGKLLVDRKIDVSLDEEARIWLADKGYDPAYGARPLKRVVQKYVQDPLAEKICSARSERVLTSPSAQGPTGWCSRSRTRNLPRPRLRREKLPKPED
jgi:ATP-dependent Clp protease ATP-binding subunit ClpB